MIDRQSGPTISSVSSYLLRLSIHEVGPHNQAVPSTNHPEPGAERPAVYGGPIIGCNVSSLICSAVCPIRIFFHQLFVEAVTTVVGRFTPPI
jgi:hypothetical protein